MQTTLFIVITSTVLAGAAISHAESRTDGLSVGIGAGHTIGAGGGFACSSSNCVQLSSPLLNTASVRLRFASGLTIEPQVSFHTDSLVGVPEMKRYSAAIGLRWPMARRGNVDLDALGSTAWQLLPQGDYQNVQVNAGIGITWWPTSNVAISTAAQTLVYARTSYQDPLGGSASYSSATIGWQPVINVMAHLYF
jgi:hypothetical protein